MASDDEIKEKTGLSREDHENRNEFNELPNGKIKPSGEDPTIWKDEDGRPWKLCAEQNAAHHQPMHLYIAFIRGYLSKCLPFMKVPNLKFFSPNADGRYSEICANRYTGELLIDQQIMGTFNFCTDAPDAMTIGSLPTTGEHDLLDIVPHNEYGGAYKYIAKGMKIGDIEKGPVVLGKLDN